MDSKITVWRHLVQQQGNGACQWCGDRRYVIAHHIQHQDTRPDLRYDVSNGVTLCRDCHQLLHNVERPSPTFLPRRVLSRRSSGVASWVPVNPSSEVLVGIQQRLAGQLMDRLVGDAPQLLIEIVSRYCVNKQCRRMTFNPVIGER